MKQRESELSSLIGANGSIYAVRRSDYVVLDRDLISDFVEPLALVLRGKRVVHEPQAVSIEEASTTHAVEYKRKVRILTRSIKGLLHMRALLNPFRYGIFSIQLALHKLLRYLVPLFLIGGFTALTSLAVIGRYRLLFIAVILGVTTALLVGRKTRPSSQPFAWACHLLFYYLMVNYAVVSAWINVIRGTGVTVWVPDRNPVGDVRSHDVVNVPRGQDTVRESAT
jgi:hypothetical protein